MVSIFLFNRKFFNNFLLKKISQWDEKLAAVKLILRYNLHVKCVKAHTFCRFDYLLGKDIYKNTPK
ncbi:hypothetical protein GCWU000282_01719 [Catonella morbi ATCC 51271]|uniref:Uncharacterized protein n=1 Tax=Catonella morbi ATCC 51271 TaxID=592026 RepID=V2XKZ3_9FIRM|nr:hypothetical protein GCWU000282_01719 [Catonella morbi ATCC 51271]